MATTVTVPTVADLPKDWKSTVFGILVSIVLLLKQYLATGVVTWEVAAIAAAVAIGFYFMPAKPSVDDEAKTVALVNKVVQDVLTKQPLTVDATVLAENVYSMVAAAMSAAPAPATPAAQTAPLVAVLSGVALPSLAPAPENGAAVNLGAASAAS